MINSKFLMFISKKSMNNSNIIFKYVKINKTANI